MRYKCKDKKEDLCKLMGLKVPDTFRPIDISLKDSPPSKISIKLSPQKRYHFKILQPPLKLGGGEAGVVHKCQKILSYK